MRKTLASLREYLQKRLCCNIPSRYLRSVYFPHPVGIVIGSQVRIGKGVTIYQNASIGRKTQGSGADGDYPTIGDGVTIYAGAVVMGGITIGDRTIVGANSLVSRDVPADSLAFSHNQVRPRRSRE